MISKFSDTMPKKRKKKKKGRREGKKRKEGGRKKKKERKGRDKWHSSYCPACCKGGIQQRKIPDINS